MDRGLFVLTRNGDEVPIALSAALLERPDGPVALLASTDLSVLRPSPPPRSPRP